MRYNYLTNRLEDGSPGVAALETRLRRVIALVRAGRLSNEDGVAFCHRDMPTVERIERATNAEWFEARRRERRVLR